MLQIPSIASRRRRSRSARCAAITWTVLPRPMSSARHPPTPSRTSVSSQWTPDRWYGRNSACSPSGVATTLAACGDSDDTAGDGGDGGDAGNDKVAVTLITKDSVNPFFVAMQEGAKKAGDENGVDITIASGAADGDTMHNGGPKNKIPDHTDPAKPPLSTELQWA